MDIAAYPKLIGDNGYCWLVVSDIRIRNMRKTSEKLKYLLLIRKFAFLLTSLFKITIKDCWNLGKDKEATKIERRTIQQEYELLMLNSN